LLSSLIRSVSGLAADSPALRLILRHRNPLEKNSGSELNAAIGKVAVAADDLPKVCIGYGTSGLTEIG
jgi:hypothetical protein